MSDRRATRYAAFFESADKGTKSSGNRKSPARKSPARKSPARNEAASIKREQSTSPVKKTSSKRPISKSPARNATKPRPKSKSPARVVKKESAKSKTVKKEVEEVEDKKSPKDKTAAKKATKKEADKKTSPKSPKKSETKNKAASSKTSKSPSRVAKELASKAIESDPESPQPRRKTRSETQAQTNDLKKSLSRSVVDASPEYSDTDEPQISFKRRGTSKLDEFKEFGGKWGCLALLILLPLITYTLHYYCTTRICSFRKPNWNDFKQLSTYYSLDLIKIILPFFLGIFTLNIFPLGRVVKVHTDRGYTEFAFNGLTLSILTIAGIVTGEYFKYNVVDTILKNYNQLILLYIINALVQAIFAYIRSGYVAQAHWNPFAKTGNFLTDFFIGREINPKWFSLVDVKLVHYHLSLITTLVLNGIFIYKNIKFPVIQTEIELKMHEKILYLLQSAKYEIAPLVISLLIIVYCLDLIIFEHHLSKTFELQYEGVGAGCLLKYAIFPFTFSLIAKYTLDWRVKVEWWVLAIIAVEFLAGVVVKRLANKAKHDFRLNPTTGQSLKLKTIPTFQGNRLLVDGLWKIVRQPNYTADIVCNMSLLLVLVGRFALPPLFALLFNILLLVHRAIRLDARHALRYDSAYQRYCKEVKNLLIPHVF